MSQRWRHEEAAAHGLNHRWRHDDATHHSTLTLRKVCAVIELRHEEGAGRSTLTLNKSLIVESVDVHPGGWHTNREGERAILVSHLAISCRDPKQFARTLESIF